MGCVVIISAVLMVLILLFIYAPEIASVVVGLALVGIVIALISKGKQIKEQRTYRDHDREFIRWCLHNRISLQDIPSRIQELKGQLSRHRGVDVNKKTVYNVFKLYYNEQQQKFIKQQREEEAIGKFYKSCVKRKCTDPHDEKQLEEMKKLASDLECATGENVAELFERGKRFAAQTEVQEKEDLLQMARNSKAQADAVLSAHPLKRRIDKLSKEVAYAKAAYDKLNKESIQLRNAILSGKQRTMDWAILGGAASAIGGTALGVVTALKAQEHNASVQTHNREVTYLAYQVDALYEPKINAAKKEWQQLKSHLKKLENLQIDKSVSADVILDNMDFFTVKPHVKLDTVVFVNGKVRSKQLMKIQGKLNADIDGVLKAVLIQDGTLLGVGYADISRNNVLKHGQRHTVSAYCMCNRPVTQSEITVQWEPYGLWLVESM